MSDDGRHIGRNIARVRELIGVKQEALAFSVGMSQQSISVIEKSAQVDDQKLDMVAQALGVSATAIRNFGGKAILDYFENFGTQQTNLTTLNVQSLFSHFLEAIEANNRLHAEKQCLYERLLQNEQEKYRNLEKTVAFSKQLNGS